MANMPEAQVRLAPPQRADAADLIAIHISNREFHAPWTAPFVDQSGFEKWFASCASDRHIGLVVRALHSNTIIGAVNITEIVRGCFQSGYLGYYGTASHARKGWMTQALRIAAHHAFHEYGLHRLEANIQPGNTASIALVRRVGFLQEGLSPRYLHIDGAWRDHQRWALLSS